MILVIYTGIGFFLWKASYDVVKFKVFLSFATWIAFLAHGITATFGVFYADTPNYVGPGLFGETYPETYFGLKNGDKVLALFGVVALVGELVAQCNQEIAGCFSGKEIGRRSRPRSDCRRAQRRASGGEVHTTRRAPPAERKKNDERCECSDAWPPRRCPVGADGGRRHGSAFIHYARHRAYSGRSQVNGRVQ